MGEIFGNPVIGIRLMVEQAGETIHQERKFDEKWYQKMGSSTLANISTEGGYQYGLVRLVIAEK